MLQALRSKALDDHHIATSANGKDVFTNLIQQPVSTAISRNPHLLSLLQRIIPVCVISGQRVSVEYDMKKPVGYTEIIASKPEDTIFYARQNKTPVYTRFVKNRNAEATSIVSICVEANDGGSYSITDVRIGPLPPADNTPKSTAFWEKHAVVYNGQPIVSSSVTKDDPSKSAVVADGDSAEVEPDIKLAQAEVAA